MAQGYSEQTFILRLDDEEFDYLRELVEKAPEDEMAGALLVAFEEAEEEEDE